MCDAKEKNATWEKIKLTNLLQLRDTHMTVAFLHIIRADSCQVILCNKDLKGPKL